MNHHRPSPLITIATVTYNAGRTLKPTLDSVAAQTYPHIEHLIVDGCSKDATMELIHRYVDENTDSPHPHDIRMTREPDRGLYDAMNKALAQATGHYIVFLNAGDRLHSPQVLQQVFGHMDTTAPLPAIVYGETDLIDGQGHFLRHRRLKAPARLTWRSFCHGMLVCHQSFYVRTDLCRNTPYNLDYRFSADFDWCIRLMRAAARQGLPLHNTHTVLTDYLSEGLTTQNHKASLRERFHIMRHHYGLVTTAVMHAWFVLRTLLCR